MAFQLAAALPLVNKILKFIPDPEQRQAAKLAMLSEKNSQEVAKINAMMSAIIAEGQSQHKLVALARPMFLYVVNLYLVMGIPFAFFGLLDPEAAREMTVLLALWFAAIPGEVLALFGTGYLGYGAYRSWDKRTHAKERTAVFEKEGGIEWQS